MNKYQNALKYVAAMNYVLSEQHGVFAIIAGGAARDTDNQKVFKDIDIFVVYDTEDSELKARVQAFFDDYPGMAYLDEHEPDNPYEENLNRIEGVEDYQLQIVNPDGLNTSDFSVQVIHQDITEGVDPLRQIVDSFDLNICQIAFKFDGETYKYVKSEGYKIDKRMHIISLTPFGRALPTVARRDKTRVRAHRIGQKLGFVRALEFNEEPTRPEQIIDNWLNDYNRVFDQVMRAG